MKIKVNELEPYLHQSKSLLKQVEQMSTKMKKEKSVVTSNIKSKSCKPITHALEFTWELCCLSFFLCLILLCLCTCITLNNERVFEPKAVLSCTISHYIYNFLF